MSNKRLKIENLENLQEVNTEEFSSIQGGMTQASISICEPIEWDCKPVPYPCEPYPLPPCKDYILKDKNGEEIHLVSCPVIL